MQRQGPLWLLRAVRATGARVALGACELDGDHLPGDLGAAILGRCPARAGLPLRARHPPRRPVDNEVAAVKALLLAGLPAVVAAGGSEQVDVKLCATAR